MTSDPSTIETTLKTGANRSRRKTLLSVLLLLAGVAGALFYWIQQHSEKEIAYTTVELSVQDLTTTVSATGNLEPTNTVDVGIEVSGTISEVLVDYNDRVTLHQPMARLDTTKLKAVETSSHANWMKSKANEQSAKAALDNARIENERVMNMYASTQGNYPSKKELQSASTALEQAKAGLAAAQAQVAQSLAQMKTDQENLKKAVVVSPIEGIVLSRKVEPGQTVVASMQTPVLFTLAEDLTKMKAIVSVDEADIGGVKEGQKVEFTVDAYPDRQFEGSIAQVRLNSAVVNGVVTYEAVVDVRNNALLLRPGMTANASIITETLHNVSVVPNAALRFTPPLTDKDEKKKHAKNGNDKASYVWVLKNNAPVKIKVQTGQSDGISTVLTDSSLQPGEQVITGVKE